MQRPLSLAVALHGRPRRDIRMFSDVARVHATPLSDIKHLSDI